MLAPRVLELLVAQHHQRAADALAGFVRQDHVVDEAARAGVVLEFDREVVETRLVIVERDGRKFVELARYGYRFAVDRASRSVGAS